MQRKLQSMVASMALGLLVPLAACNNTNVKSNVAQKQALGITKVRLVFDSKMPDEIGIRKVAYGRYVTQADAKVNDGDRMQTRARMAQMYVVFLNGFKTSFPREAAKYGLEIAQPSEDAPELRLSVKSLHSLCSGGWCNPSFEISGKLVARDSTELWSLTVSNPPTPVPKFEQHYEFVEKAILEQMLDDNVIPLNKEQQANRAKSRFVQKY